MIVVLAVGSTAPGLLQAVIGWFAQVFPDYRERVLRHEAAHFLVHDLLMLAFISTFLSIQRIMSLTTTGMPATCFLIGADRSVISTMEHEIGLSYSVLSASLLVKCRVLICTCVG